ncbi:zinc finger protein, partial [Oryctes borbonicus]
IQDSNTIGSPAESNFANEECELENTQIGTVIFDDSPKSSSQENQEIKQEHTSTSANQNETISRRTLKDSPEICKCFICGKYLSNQYNLRVHMETHKDTYYSCLSCPHVSKSRDALRKHVSYRHPEEYISRKRKKNMTS